MAAQTSTRKQWRLFRGPKGDIQSHGWAEFGCPESQVKLARELLQDNSEDVDRERGEEKSRLAVYWLLKASEKGHEEATSLLRQCLISGTGISEQNISDVRSCLAMPKEEKLSREAAKELFSCLSQGGNFITSNQLFRETLKYRDGPVTSDGAGEEDWWKCGVREEWLEPAGAGLDRLTEEMLLAAGSGHSRGELPRSLQRLPLTAGSSRLSALLVSSVTLLDRVGSEIRLVHVLLLVSLLGLRTVLECATGLLHWLSLCVMLVSTAQLLCKGWEFAHFQRWSWCLTACGCSDEVSLEAQWRRAHKNWQPFFLFTGALTGHLFTSPTDSSPLDLSSQLATLSAAVSLYILYNLACRRKGKLNILVIVTFLIHFISRYPYDMEGTYFSEYWKYLELYLPTCNSFVIGGVIEYHLNLRVVLYLLLPGLFLKMSARENWLGLPTVLLPSLVSLAWTQLAFLSAQNATYSGVIRSTLCFLLSSVLLIGGHWQSLRLSLQLLCLGQFYLGGQLSKTGALAASAFVSLLYLIASRYRRLARSLTLIQIVLCFSSVVFLLKSGEMTVSVIDGQLEGGLSWSAVKDLCPPVAGARLEEEEKCKVLTGGGGLIRLNSWEGQVLSTRLSSLHNPLLPLVTLLPPALQDYVICTLGELQEVCPSSGNDDDDDDAASDCVRHCSLSNWNRLQYEITVQLRDGAEASGGLLTSDLAFLTADLNLRNFTLSLNPGDNIKFSGLLTGMENGGKNAKVHLEAASCTSCSSQSST